MRNYTSADMEAAIKSKLQINYGIALDEATEAYMFKACALVLRDMMALNGSLTAEEARKKRSRQVHYMSLEFLMGRSLMKNAFNLGVLGPMEEAIENMGFKAADIFEIEPDAGLGNGGLGRLAACYLDSMTTLDIRATGYSICYELGIFRQRIVDGQQVELPDNWKEMGDAWLIPKPEETEEVKFGGTLREYWDNGRLRVANEGCNTVLAIPCDMEIAGYKTDHVNSLRLWDAKSPTPLDMSLFSSGQYIKASEEQTMADTIAKILYPADEHIEGKSLRLKQQYFFVSATVQSVVRKHMSVYGTLDNFAEKNVFQINDTHPALVIPELMRILVDDAGFGWDRAWEITTASVAYTNHTVLSEALERWPQSLIALLLPRVWQIICEISRRWQARVEKFYNHNDAITERMAVIWGGEVRMANLCIAGGMAVNGVSALHSKILREVVFRDACAMEPEKFKSITNGVDHRRWLAQSNPRLAALIRDLNGGDGYLTDADELSKLERYASDGAVLSRLAEIKRLNKEDFSGYCAALGGGPLDPDSIFDVQVKRLHEYKRQLLNALHIIYLYQKIHDEPNIEMRPQTFLIGAKAAPGYAMAKKIIRLINSLSQMVNNDKLCRGKLDVRFLENYRVSLAEKLMPASEVSEQISTAGKEASGTGNMKFMMNGALTIGTLDGANVEMHDALGDDNMFLFGLNAEQAAEIKATYDPMTVYGRDDSVRRAVDQLRTGFGDGVSYEDIYSSLLVGGPGRADEYLLLMDFASYCDAQRRVTEAYGDARRWNAMSLRNIARSGIFSADRAVREYADGIWRVKHK
jgi:starch phosphorylase